MARSKFVIDPNTPYNISARCINKDWFGMPLDDVWEVMQNHLYFMSCAFDINIHSFVLMSNHYHLIASSPEGNLSKAMAYFMKSTSENITKPLGRINQTYGARFHRTRLDNYYYFMNAYKYLYLNPVRANICKRVEDYKYSTIRGLLGLDKLVIPVTDNTLLLDDTESHLKWLNTKPREEHSALVKKALKRRVFKYPKVKQQENPFEKQLL